MKAVISVDPGVRKGGCCVSIDGVVVRAGTVVGYSPQDWAESVLLFAYDALASRPVDQVEWVVERMVLRDSQDVKYKDLKAVEDSVDRLTDGIRRSSRLRGRVHRITPETWKRQVPKEICQRRIQRELKPGERAALRDEGHDQYDATGINLFHTGRLKAGMV